MVMIKGSRTGSAVVTNMSTKGSSVSCQEKIVIQSYQPMMSKTSQHKFSMYTVVLGCQGSVCILQDSICCWCFGTKWRWTMTRIGRQAAKWGHGRWGREGDKQGEKGEGRRLWHQRLFVRCFCAGFFHIKGAESWGWPWSRQEDNGICAPRTELVNLYWTWLWRSWGGVLDR